MNISCQYIVPKKSILGVLSKMLVVAICSFLLLVCNKFCKSGTEALRGDLAFLFPFLSHGVTFSLCQVVGNWILIFSIHPTSQIWQVDTAGYSSVIWHHNGVGWAVVPTRFKIKLCRQKQSLQSTDNHLIIRSYEVLCIVLPLLASLLPGLLIWWQCKHFPIQRIVPTKLQRLVVYSKGYHFWA